MSEEKKIKFKVARPVQIESARFGTVQYGIGEYDVSEQDARALEAKGAGTRLADHFTNIRLEEDEAERRRQAEAAGRLAEEEEQQAREAAERRAQSLGQQQQPSAGSDGQMSTPQPPAGMSTSAIEGLKGDLPENFPSRAELAAAPQSITRYEQLTPLTNEQIAAIPGLDQTKISLIGRALFEAAQGAGGASSSGAASSSSGATTISAASGAGNEGNQSQK